MNAACRVNPASPDPQSDRPMADGQSKRQGRSQPAHRAGRVKPSPAAPSLQPPAYRPEGGKSLARPPFSAFSKSRASEARQARRATPCGQGLRRGGYVGKACLVHISTPQVLLSIRQIPAHGWRSTRRGVRGEGNLAIRTRNAGAGPLAPRHAASRLGVRVLLVTMGATAPIPPNRSVYGVSGGSTAHRELGAMLCRGCFKILESRAHPIHFPHQPTNIRAQRGHQRYSRGSSTGDR